MRHVIHEIIAPARDSSLLTVRDLLRLGDTGFGETASAPSIFCEGIAYAVRDAGRLTMLQPEDGLRYGLTAEFDERCPLLRLAPVASLSELTCVLNAQLRPGACSMVKGRVRLHTLTLRGEQGIGAAAYGDLIALYSPTPLADGHTAGWHFWFVDAACRHGGMVETLSSDAPLCLRINRLGEVCTLCPHAIKTPKEH